MGRFVGVDVGSSTIKAVQITGKGNKLSISNAYLLPTPEATIMEGVIIDYDELSKQAAKVYDSGGFGKVPAAVAVKGDTAIARFARIPYVNQEQLEKNIFFFAEQYVSMDPEEYAVDYDILSTDQTSASADVIFAANRHDTISDYLSIFKSAGIDVGAMDLEVLALCELYSFMQLPDTGSSMITHIGKNTVLYIFLENGKFRYYEAGSCGGDYCSSVLISLAKVRDDEVERVKSDIEGYEDSITAKNTITNNYLPDLTGEMEHAVSSYMLMGGRPPERIYFSGGGASVYGLFDVTGERFSVMSSLINPAASINVTSVVAKQILENKPAIMNIAVAMALR